MCALMCRNIFDIYNVVAAQAFFLALEFRIGGVKKLTGRIRLVP
jgi:hypothetical protein